MVGARILFCQPKNPLFFARRIDLICNAMKKNPKTLVLESISSDRQVVSVQRFANPGRLLVALACASMAALAPIQAAAPDGTYKLSSAAGSLQAAGQVVEVTSLIAETFTVTQNGKTPQFTVKNGRLKINPTGAVKLIEALGERFGGRFDFDKVSGPKSIELRKSGKNHVGSASKPIVVKFSSPAVTETGILKSVVRAKVKGEKLTITIPLKGTAMGNPISGTVTLVATK
jgi:hypothetical protein